jgi:hydroxymethylbilane synthase
VNRIILGTRGSALALAQATLTQEALASAFPELKIEQEVFVTRGDQKLDLSLIRASEAGGKGLFTKELEDALLAGSIDLAVHSLKDLPGHQPAGLQLTAVLERAPTGDVLIAREPLDLDSLPQGAKVGTSSVRRARQIQWLRPDLAIEEWRGNVGTRLRKLRERQDVSGIVLAEAGLRRLGMEWTDNRFATEHGEFHAASLASRLLPAIGQGAIALQSRENDERVNGLLAAVNHEPTWVCIRAERMLQLLLSGDCSLPVGVRCELADGSLSMRAILFGDGDSPPAESQAIGSEEDPEELARVVFRGLGTAAH